MQVTRTIGTANLESTSNASAANLHTEDVSFAGSYRQAYRELADKHVVEMDAVEQLRANISQLEDLHARLRFMMSEVSYLLKKA